MRLPNPISWWHGLPRKMRVRIIAFAFLALAGTELLFLAPFIIEMAAMIDLMGLVFIGGAILTSLEIWRSQLAGVCRHIMGYKKFVYDCWSAMQEGICTFREISILPALVLMRMFQSALFWSSMAVCSIVSIRLIELGAQVVLEYVKKA
jgi:hypothetical protein